MEKFYFPGSMSMALAAVQCFGADRVNVGAWLSPVIVYDVTPKELKAFEDLTGEKALDPKLF